MTNIVQLDAYRAENAAHRDETPPLNSGDIDPLTLDTVAELTGMMRECGLPLRGLVACVMASVLQVGIERAGDIDEAADVSAFMLYAVIGVRRRIEAGRG